VSEQQGHQPSARDEVLPEQTSDDTDLGWGEQQDEAAEDERLRREKPPHW
jgi:hypothetical protein